MITRFIVVLFIVLAPVWSGSQVYADTQVSLDKAIESALATDEWFERSAELESAAISEARQAGALPDPMISLSVMNLPADSWEFDQENMTQLLLGLTQKFPKGSTRSIKREKAELKASVQPLLRADREAMLRLQVATHWLKSYRSAKSIELIEDQRYLFEQLVEITTSRYSSTVGRARQQDVIRAQLELTKLEDRLTRLRMAYAKHWGMLSEWLPPAMQEASIALELPGIPEQTRTIASPNDLVNHPKIAALQKDVEMKRADERLSREEYKPGWALKASYGYREDSPAGMDRSDFVSLGVAFDLPVFTKNRQDQRVSMAESSLLVAEIDHRLLIKNMWAKYRDASAQVKFLASRKELFENTLLRQTKEQAEASLSSFTNDDGDFADVVRAYITDLNTRIEAMEIEVQFLQARAEIDYLLTVISPEMAGTEGEKNEF